jgi:hypothetical protein
MFSGEAVTDPQGSLVPGVVNIVFSSFRNVTNWAVSPPTDPFPNAEWALYDGQILISRGQNYATLKVEGSIKFYVTSRDSLHEGTTKPFYQMIGQVDLTSGLKTTEENSWGSVKALYR